MCNSELRGGGNTIPHLWSTSEQQVISVPRQPGGVGTGHLPPRFALAGPGDRSSGAYAQFFINMILFGVYGRRGESAQPAGGGDKLKF